MLLNKHPLSFIIILSGAIYVLLTACSQEVAARVDTFTYSFGFEYKLVKHGEYCVIEVRNVWKETQVEPPPDFDEAPYVVPITEEECASIFSQILQIQWGNYSRLEDSDFLPSAPGLRHREHLLLEIDGETKVDWTRDFQVLAEELRYPLERLNQVIANFAEKRMNQPIIPYSLQLTLAESDSDGTHHFELSRSGGSNRLVSVFGEKTMSVQQLEQLWKRILDLRLFRAEYVPISDEAPKSDAGGDEFSVTINGHKLVEFSYEKPYEEQERISELHKLLTAAAKDEI